MLDILAIPMERFVQSHWKSGLLYRSYSEHCSLIPRVDSGNILMLNL